MTLPDENIQEMTAYQNGPFQNLTIQDALTIIAVCASQMDPEDCQQDIKRAAAIIRNRPEFEDHKEGISSRFNRYVNSTQVVDPAQALEMAAGVLENPEVKKSAFELAVEVAMTGKNLTGEKRVILEKIAKRLHLDPELRQRTIDKFAG